MSTFKVSGPKLQLLTLFHKLCNVFSHKNLAESLNSVKGGFGSVTKILYVDSLP
jgi:hypothetical protein